jgi:HAE1 family hydrophobic/amphiphilic exporter-1
MAIRGITVDDLSNAIRSNTSYQGAGQFDGDHHTFLLQPQGQLETAADYENIIIDTVDGAPLYLKNVAKVYDSLQDERIKLSFWLRDYKIPPAAVVLAVFRQAGSNTVEVANSVKKLIPIIRAEIPGRGSGSADSSGPVGFFADRIAAGKTGRLSRSSGRSPGAVALCQT